MMKRWKKKSDEVVNHLQHKI